MPDAVDPDTTTPEEPEQASGPITAATERFIATAGEWDDADLRAPSKCDGWTRAHVIAHVARNADALANLLTWASTGVVTPMYPSAEARAADIDAGSARSAADLADDLRRSASTFTHAVSSLPETAWERPVRTGPGGAGSAIPARRVLWLRLRELELHHVDLDAGYYPADWPMPFVARALPESLKACERRESVPPFRVVVNGTQVGGLTETTSDASVPTVFGEAADVLAWITGRGSGVGLRVEPAVALPEIPAGAWL